MKRKLIILEQRSFFDFEKKLPSLGGVQTYVQYLAQLGLKLGFDVTVYLVATENESEKEFIYQGYKIKTLYKKYLLKNHYQSCFDYLSKNVVSEQDKIVIARDIFYIKNKLKNSVTIQHGISYDIPRKYIGGFWKKNKILQMIYKWIRSYRSLNLLYWSRNIVCVDYNFYNWFKTLGTIEDKYNIYAIPNFVSDTLPTDKVKEKVGQCEKRIKKIVFARRFEHQRGPILFSNVIKRLLKERDDIDVTLAGTGTLLEQSISILKGYDNVHFTTYRAEESIDFHKHYDIAVVPTIWSEGTSLSLLEAMAAACFPIASYVGGMSNIILDSFNGKFFNPKEDDLYEVLNEVLDMSEVQFHQIQLNAYKSVVSAFSREKWEEKWTKVLTR